ncbi:Dedicator of cytokinesis protein 1 [Sarcoptes scabiei]|uniref:Dedicator of cytokinesis protein 1 n=1 Tax=Sarcoptes scabiei TaxID=52283 RepID=A0A834R6G7_SARSC|nr:Dedicator of cytokinesis protein 1 [Sarcoptes scabiei]
MSKIICYTKEKILFKEYSQSLWNQLFRSAIKFILQESLSLESFSLQKRRRLESINSKRDLRLEMTSLVRSLWYNLSTNKSKFIPFLIGPLLEISLLPVASIRKDTIVIFFDMFYSCLEKSKTFRDEMITQLDLLITSGRGDREFSVMLATIFLESSENHSEEIKEIFKTFIDEICEQIDKLLVYREIVNNLDHYEMLMGCLIELLEFYDRIDRKELYIRYLYKLFDLHLQNGNYCEAAYTLTKHSCLLEWSDKKLDNLLKYDLDHLNQNENLQSLSFQSTFDSHRELKERLYLEIIENFHKGQLWEAGLFYCKELIQQYENEIFDYNKLAQLLQKMSSFYKLIITSIRIEPEYFHVSYLGQGFPKFLSNKSFIYRGKSYERLFEFTKRLLKQFPCAKQLERLDFDPKEFEQSSKQFLSIYKVDPNLRDSVRDKFANSLVDERIIKYYQFNEIDEFEFSRKLKRANNDSDRPNSNEFATMWIERSYYRTQQSLPGILCRSEIKSTNSFELNPLQNAIDTMRRMNEKTKMLIYRYLLDDEGLHPVHALLMHIKGIVSSDVQGGVSKYEEAFFDETMITRNEYDPNDIHSLKQLIANQIPLVALALKIVDQKQKQITNNQTMDGLYQYIFEEFEKMHDDVAMKYGKSDLPNEMKRLIENHHKMQKLASAMMSNSNANSSDSARNSLEHRGSIDGTMTLKRSLFSRSNNNGSNTLRFRRKDSRKSNYDMIVSKSPLIEQSSKQSPFHYASTINISSQTQWYTDHKKSFGNLSMISDSAIESNSFNEEGIIVKNDKMILNNSSNELKPNTTIIKQSSRPNSGQYSNRASIQSQLSLYYPPSASSISLDDENDQIPPPLPGKKLSISSESKIKH